MPSHDAPPVAGTSRVRRRLSIALSILSIVVALQLLAFQVFESPPSFTEPGVGTILLRIFEDTAPAWFTLPVLALLLSGGSTWRGPLPMLPKVLGILALALLALCTIVPALMSGGLLAFIGLYP